MWPVAVKFQKGIKLKSNMKFCVFVLPLFVPFWSFTFTLLSVYGRYGLNALLDKLI